MSAKGLRQSIKSEALIEEATKNRGVLAAMQGEYNREVVPMLHEAIQKHLDNTRAQVGNVLQTGVPGVERYTKPVFQISTFSGTARTQVSMRSDATWARLSTDYLELKDATSSNSGVFWKYTGGLEQAYNTLKNTKIGLQRSGFRGGHVPKNLNKELKMTSTFKVPVAKSPVNELLVQPFIAGVNGEGYQSITDKTFANGLLNKALSRSKGAQSQTNANNLFKMVLAEADRPFVAQMSSTLGEWLGRDMSTTWDGGQS